MTRLRKRITAAVLGGAIAAGTALGGGALTQTHHAKPMAVGGCGLDVYVYTLWVCVIPASTASPVSQI